jgi:hypothetical protein
LSIRQTIKKLKIMYLFNQANFTISQLVKSIEDKCDGIQVYISDLYLTLTQEIYDKYSLPAFHLTGDGFSIGDATPDEAIEAFENIHENEETPMFTKPWFDEENDQWDYSELMEFLDKEFINEYVEKVNAKVESMDMWEKLMTRLDQ